jgi:predicted CoA-binding protein
VKPPTIAIVGASNDRRKYGNKCVRAYLDAGFQVFPVNLHEAEIEGLEAYRSLDEVPVPVDRVSLYLPPETTWILIPDLARQAGAQIWFNPGSADSRVLAEARAAGLEVRAGCSIVDIGRSPGRFP